MIRRADRVQEGDARRQARLRGRHGARRLRRPARRCARRPTRRRQPDRPGRDARRSRPPTARSRAAAVAPPRRPRRRMIAGRGDPHAGEPRRPARSGRDQPRGVRAQEGGPARRVCSDGSPAAAATIRVIPVPGARVRSRSSLIEAIMLIAIFLLIAFPVHEFCHALAAYRLGDGTAKHVRAADAQPDRPFRPGRRHAAGPDVPCSPRRASSASAGRSHAGQPREPRRRAPRRGARGGCRAAVEPRCWPLPPPCRCASSSATSCSSSTRSSSSQILVLFVYDQRLPGDLQPHARSRRSTVSKVLFALVIARDRVAAPADPRAVRLVHPPRDLVLPVRGESLGEPRHAHPIADAHLQRPGGRAKVRQFRAHLRARVAPDGAGGAGGLADPPQLRLFDSMHVADRRHGLDVVAIAARAGRRPTATSCSPGLLHDAGKGNTGVWPRVAFSLGEAYGPWVWRVAGVPARLRAAARARCGRTPRRPRRWPRRPAARHGPSS